MAFNWTDISNNEVANSVRTKLNALGTSYANIVRSLIILIHK